MSPVFPLEQREKIKLDLLEAGIFFIREKGIKQMTIDEVTRYVGIGKGTFYHFFKSKELFVYEVIQFSKENLYSSINSIIEEKGVIDRSSFLQLLSTFSFSGSGNIISSITAEDEAWLAAKLPPEYILNPPKEEQIISVLLNHMSNVRPNINFHVLANMMKIMALSVENRSLLHQDALFENLSIMQMQLCNYIFNKENETKQI